MFGLSIGDIIVLGLYLAVIFSIAFWSMTRIKNQEDYFMGGRRFSRIIQVFSAFGQATSADTGPSVTTTTANNGASGIWSALMMLFATPSYWFTGVWYRRMRVLTMADYFQERYGSRALGVVYSLLSSVGLMILLSVGFIGITKTVMVMTPKTIAEYTPEEKTEYNKAIRLETLQKIDYATLSPTEKEELRSLQIENPDKNFSHINKNTFIWIMVLIVVSFTVIGGLEAAFVSDLLQGVFILILSLILIPFALIKINHEFGSSGLMGSLRTIHEVLPESFFEIFGSPYTIDFTWYYILAISVLATINVAAGPNQLVASGSAKNDYNARYGLTFGTYLKRIAIVFWGFTALALTVLYKNSLQDTDKLWGYAARDLLGPINIGLIGLLISSLIAALIATSSMMMLTTSGLLTNNIYRHIVPGKSEKHYVTIGRLLGTVVVFGGAIMVLKTDSILNQLKANWEFSIIYSSALWMGILWRRTTVKAIWTSIIATFTIFYLIPILLPILNPSIRSNQFLLMRTNEVVEERTYTARAMDVTQRQMEIERWEKLAAEGKATEARPETIVEGQRFTKKYKQPEKSIFWPQGIVITDNGQMIGKGMLNVDLLALQLLGFNMQNNKYAVNETLRVIIRLLFPFLLVILISYLTRHTKKESENLDFFYAKMKTPVTGNKEIDERELQLSRENPKRFDHTLIFPNTHWQFCKWNKEDGIGFAVSCLMVVAILGLLYFLVNIGG